MGYYKKLNWVDRMIEDYFKNYDISTDSRWRWTESDKYGKKLDSWCRPKVVKHTDNNDRYY